MIRLALPDLLLVERQVRTPCPPTAEIDDRPARLRPRPSQCRTGRTIFQGARRPALIPADDGIPAMIPEPAGCTSGPGCWTSSASISAERRWLTQRNPDVRRPADARHRDGPLRQARQALGPGRSRAAQDRGAAMSMATAAEYASC